ncbi:MAG: HTH domain-containing protein, partial [Peptostreptococcaceae bacterium]
KLGYIENYATGLNRIYKEYNKLNKDIIIDTQMIYFKVIFPNLNYNKYSNVTDSITVGINDEINVGIKLSKNAINIFKEIINDNKITTIELSRRFDLSTRTIDRYIKELKDKGYIINKTSNKNGKWILNKTIKFK